MRAGLARATAALMALASAPVRAQDWPGHATYDAGASGVGLVSVARKQLVPPFRAAAVDEVWLGGAAWWSPAPGATLRATWGWVRHAWQDGTVVSSPGDVRLAVVARPPLPTRPGLPEVWAGAEVKLPNAGDEAGAGTDETDVTVLASLRWTTAPVTVVAGAGLAVLGDPLQYANQDDALVWGGSATARWPGWPFLAARMEGSGRARSPRNPAVAGLEGGLEGRLGRSCWTVGLMAGPGLTPAAADLSGRAWVAWSRPALAEGCLSASGD